MIAGGVVDPSGIVEIVAGTGGHSSQGITRTDSRAVKTNKSYGAFRMDMFGNRADLKYYAISATANTLVDSSTVTCKGTDGLAPTAPANLTATAGAGSTAMLGWAASTDNYGVTGYRVYRDGTAVADLAGSATSWTDTTSAGATTYTYAVDAVDAAGNRSVRSNSAAVTIGGPDTTAPTVPTGLNATPSASAVSLSWSASTDNVGVTGYRVLRDGVVVDTTSATTYADSTVAANTTHNWAVRAFDAAGNTSAASASVASVRDTVAPSTPGNLRVTGIAPGAVSLAWDASTDNVGVKTYRLYRDGGVLAEVAATTFTDYTAGGAGTTHTYQVRAVDAAGNASAASNSATANAADSSPPTVPTGLQATATGPNRVSLSWTASTDDVGVSGYTVFRNGTAIASTATTTFQDTSPLSETTYSYTILARDAAGNSSAQSTAVAVTTPAATAIAAVADTYVKATTATSNYGRATSLRVDGDPATNAYLKFTVAGVTGPVLRARLRIWVVAGSSTGFVTHPVADSSWSETLTNWNNAPAIGSAVLSSSGATTVGTWVTVDITPLVTGNGTVTVALTSGGLSAASYGSRESSMAPQLLLDATS
jgi:fibronectin type 3 domain-containing protein